MVAVESTKIKLVGQKNVSQFFTSFDIPNTITIVANKSKFVCSSIILAQRSTVFQKAIYSGEEEFILEDFCTPLCDEIIRDCIMFLYGDYMELNMANIKTVTKLCSKYHFNSLWDHSVSYIKKILKTDIHSIWKIYSIVSDITGVKKQSLLEIYHHHITEHYDMIVANLQESISSVDINLENQDVLELIITSSQSHRYSGSLITSLLKSKHFDLVFKNLENLNYSDIYEDLEAFNHFIDVAFKLDWNENHHQSIIKIQSEYHAQNLTRSEDVSSISINSVENLDDSEESIDKRQSCALSESQKQRSSSSILNTSDYHSNCSSKPISEDNGGSHTITKPQIPAQTSEPPSAKSREEGSSGSVSKDEKSINVAEVDYMAQELVHVTTVNTYPTTLKGTLDMLHLAQVGEVSKYTVLDHTMSWLRKSEVQLKAADYQQIFDALKQLSLAKELFLDIVEVLSAQSNTGSNYESNCSTIDSNTFYISKCISRSQFNKALTDNSSVNVHDVDEKCEVSYCLIKDHFISVIVKINKETDEEIVYKPQIGYPLYHKGNIIHSYILGLDDEDYVKDYISIRFNTKTDMFNLLKDYSGFVVKIIYCKNKDIVAN